MHRGFIQIPILIAIIITAVLSGGAYVAYEVAKPSQNTSPNEIAAESQATTTADISALATVEDKKEEVKSDERDSIIGSLKKQVADLTQKVAPPKTEPQNTAPKTTILTLPSGAIVEMDANGNIIRTIKEVSQQAYTTPTPTVQTQTVASVQISSVNITPTITTAKIEWQTDKPTESKIFLSGGGLSSKIYNSESGPSTQHSVSINGLISGTNYSYEIEVIVPASPNSFSKKAGNFSTIDIERLPANDNFDPYILGSVNGQGGWKLYSGSSFIVQNSVTHEGTSALYAENSGIITKSEGLKSEGTQAVYIKTKNRSTWNANSDGNVQIRIASGPWASGAPNLPFVAVTLKADGNVAYYNPLNDKYTDFATYSDNEWVLLEIQWQLSDKTARYRVNQGLWTEWNTFKSASYFEGFDNVGLGFFDVGSGGVYFDSLH